MGTRPIRWLSVIWGTTLLLMVLITWVSVAKGESDTAPLIHRSPKGVDMNKKKLLELDQVMKQAVDQGVFPGGQVLVIRRGHVVYDKAFGYAHQYVDDQKSTVSKPVRARSRTIYDIASISKLFTATAVMQLVEQNQLDLDEPVSRYLPLFSANGKEFITIRQLLTHTSGLPASIRLSKFPGGREEKLNAIYQCQLVNSPGTKVVYSDVGYIVLGELVAKVSGMSLDQYMEKHIFQPLGLDSTMYNPPAHLKKRIAATEYQATNGRGLVWGEVHDENAWLLDGVAGHAGIFSDGENLAKFALVFLNHGQWQGKRILKSETIAEMTHLQTGVIPGSQRGLGFELNQDWYMGSFSKGQSFGHTGFTGTSLFISPDQECIVIMLTNRVHPMRKGPNVSEVRKQVAETVYESLTRN